MPAYNFKGQFAGMVEDGSKPHTIRKPRKRPTVVGDTLFLYTGMRTKSCRRLRAPTRCDRIIPVLIEAKKQRVVLGRAELTNKQVDGLARADGFRGLHPALEFFAFFASTYGPKFTGELIEWNPSR